MIKIMFRTINWWYVGNLIKTYIFNYIFLGIVVGFGFAWLLFGCTPKYPYTPVLLPSESQIPTDLKKDLIAQAIVNKEKSLLQEMFIEIMNGGTIIKKKVTAQRYGDGTEVSVEEWTVEDGLTPPNTYTIKWENGVLTDIVTLEKTEKEYKPLGKK